MSKFVTLLGRRSETGSAKSSTVQRPLAVHQPPIVQVPPAVEPPPVQMPLAAQLSTPRNQSPRSLNQP